MPTKAEQWKEYKASILDRLTQESVNSIYSDVRGTTSTGTDWTQGLCPFHDDNDPSFGFNRKTGRFKCFSGCGGGSIFDYLVQTQGVDFKAAMGIVGQTVGFALPENLRRQSKKKKQAEKPPIEEKRVEAWHAALLANENVLRWLREKRGLTDATIKEYQIGWDAKRQRNTIPIRDARGNVVNVRLYNSKKKPKITNFTDGKWRYGSPARLYGIDQLAKSTEKQVILCEGEFDRLLLVQEGFIAVTGTHGASTFLPDWLQYFEGRDVVLVYDCDPEGQKAAQGKVANAMKAAGAESIKNVVLPLKGTKDDKDVTDFLHHRGNPGAALQKLIDDAEAMTFEDDDAEEEVLKLESFVNIEHEEMVDKKIQCELTVCGETSEAFHAVESFRIAWCPKMEKGGCYGCKGVIEPHQIPRGSREYIGSCMASDMVLEGMLRKYACRLGQKPTIEILDRTTVKEFFVHQRVQRITHSRDDEGNVVQLLDGQKQELIEKRVYHLSSEHLRPGSYLATGWVKSHPKTQQITMLIEEMVPQEDDFEAFKVADRLEELRAFRALSWREKLDDLRDHVTRVYERDELLIPILLTFCSPRWIPFNNDIIRGWLVTTIIGDSGSGKTQTFQRLAEFCGVGDTFSGLTGSRTGLAYALVEHKQKGWQVRVGRYPANSRKLLAVDEIQHIQESDLRVISKAMEEGFLQIDRVSSKGYESQTRLIMIANPKYDKVMDHFALGCLSLKTVFPPTIIRRTDIAVFVNNNDLRDLSVINRRYEGGAGRKITPDMLRAAIYWTWNLTPDRIDFTEAATDACLETSQKLSDIYGHAHDVPLITISDCRNNLARLAAAVAAFQLSTDDNFDILKVLPGHIEMAASLLENIYSHDACALDTYSALMRRESTLDDYDRIEADFLKRYESGRGGGPNKFAIVIWNFFVSQKIRRDDLAEVAGCSTDNIKKIVKLLKRHALLESGRDGYQKKPKFARFLRRLMKRHPEFVDPADQDFDDGDGDDDGSNYFPEEKYDHEETADV